MLSRGWDVFGVRRHVRMRLEEASNLYRYTPIWRRCADNLLLYRVVEILGVGFVVQSRDYIYPDAAQEQIHRLDRQFEELIFEMPPELRMRPRSSIKEAVAEFDRQFQDDA